MSDVDERPAARVICLDRDGRVLLMHWYDHVDDTEVWEPPGGRLEPGETPLEAARRELTEETGLPGSAVLDRHVEVDRDFRWLGTRFLKRELFYLARFAEARPPVDPGALTEEERAAFRGCVWVEELPEGVDPPELASLIEQLTRNPDAAEQPA
ncbi:Dihydroneopterin triphosphate pyrophosphohydolase, putative, Actinobacterial type, NudB-like [[Actinomadura] parvosata subsp. kistnae]|uniref:NUDIX domain-containing protein n=1 Tax=[Actinomadura] parvosata subsp. kistnae TaxID=1909395 RepID=A0A1V0AHR0_9ACTN|nr:NUDIX domain-containing protein [Nonomuraea sp. ATCC 55076]AQZ69709.1 NUDIX domain-containing protein [Nonomuraea sp. ATCC 55076]SPL91574.1 Dihydroneopterin triphosphate pyrophosphohydolase, putative, Actinobacterial type, NudB-like [Actinomadura parvosata subsp. kistnae]